MRQSTTIITPPAVEPVSLVDAKAYMRVTSSDDDSLISDMIIAARALCEQHTRRSIITQTLALHLDSFPNGNTEWFAGVREMPVSELRGGAREVQLPQGRVQSITSVVTYDESNTASTLSSDVYRVDQAGDRLILNDQKTWPVALRHRDAVVITYVAGYGATGASVPYQIREAIKQIVNALYNNRGCDAGAMPEGAKRLLAPYRILNEHNYGL